MDESIQLPLTGLQARVLRFVYRFIQEKLYPPTGREIQDELGIANPGSVYQVLTALAKKGYLVKQKNISRGIRLTPLARKVCARDQQLSLDLEKIIKFSQ